MITKIKSNRRFKLKGYLKLKNEGKIFELRKISQLLGDVDFKISNLGYDYDRGLSAKQFLLNFISGKRLNEEIIYSIGSKKKINFFPIPVEYQKVLEDNNIRISKTSCSLSFSVLVFLFWGYGVLYFFKTIFGAIWGKKNLSSKKYIYFDRINRNNLPSPYSDGQSYDVITWFINYFQINDMDIVFPVKNYKSNKYVGNNLFFKAEPFALDIRKSNFFKILFQSLRIIFSSLISFRWSNWILLSEDLKANFYNLSGNEKKNLTKYLVPNSITFFRPIWTYYAEKNGTKVISYFYSISEVYTLKKNNFIHYDHLRFMNWPIIYVWDKFQKIKISNLILSKSKLQIVGPIPFSTTDIDLLKIKKPILAIFDIDPIIQSIYFGISTLIDLDANNPKIHIKFINDIIDTFSCKYDIVIKPKRGANNYYCPIYKDFLKELDKQKNISIVSHLISAHRIISKSNLIVSFPFTSASIIAKNLNIPTFYYDPTGEINKKDKASHGILVLNTKSELLNWKNSDLLKMEKHNTHSNE